MAFIDGDAPEVVHADDEALAGRLLELTYDALSPCAGGVPAPERVEDGQVDLLRVACDYLGPRPTVADFNAPVPGALVALRVS